MGSLSAEEQKKLDSRLLKAVESASAETIHALVRMGANPDCKDEDRAFRPIHLAASTGNLPALRALLSLGADALATDNLGNTPLMYAAYGDQPDSISCLLHDIPDYPLEQANINGYTALEHTLAPYYRESAMIRLLDAGANPHMESYGKDGNVHSPYDAAVTTQNGDAMHIMNQYGESQFPGLAGISREAVLAADSLLLKHPRGWQRFDTMAALLDEAGTPLTKADLLTPYHKDHTLLARAAECNALDKAVAYLNARGEVLTAQDLLTEEGAPNAVLQSCIERQSAGDVMRFANWKTQSREAMQQVWEALPETAREQVNNYFSLRTQLSQDAQTQARGR